VNEKEKIFYLFKSLLMIYIIFGSTDESLCREFSKLMQGELEMSLMGELTFFLGLQINQAREGTFFSQTKYALELLKNPTCKIASLSPLPWPRLF
jgi:hypothetical protein